MEIHLEEMTVLTLEALDAYVYKFSAISRERILPDTLILSPDNCRSLLMSVGRVGLVGAASVLGQSIQIRDAKIKIYRTMDVENNLCILK